MIQDHASAIGTSMVSACGSRVDMSVQICMLYGVERKRGNFYSVGDGQLPNNGTCSIGNNCQAISKSHNIHNELFQQWHQQSHELASIVARSTRSINLQILGSNKSTGEIEGSRSSVCCLLEKPRHTRHVIRGKLLPGLSGEQILARVYFSYYLSWALLEISLNLLGIPIRLISFFGPNWQNSDVIWPVITIIVGFYHSSFFSCYLYVFSRRRNIHFIKSISNHMRKLTNLTTFPGNPTDLSRLYTCTLSQVGQ